MSSRRGDLSKLTMEKLIPISRNMKIDHEEVLQGFPGLAEDKRKGLLISRIMDHMDKNHNPNEVYCNVCSVVSKLTCSKCLTVHYCSAEHQKQDWATHKLLCKLVRSDADIQAAVNLWCSDRTKALKKYGHISEWNTSKVTNMKDLLHGKRNFNDDISKWDVSSVTDI